MQEKRRNWNSVNSGEAYLPDSNLSGTKWLLLS